MEWEYLNNAYAQHTLRVEKDNTRDFCDRVAEHLRRPILKVIRAKRHCAELFGLRCSCAVDIRLQSFAQRARSGKEEKQSSRLPIMQGLRQRCLVFSLMHAELRCFGTAVRDHL